MDLTRKQCELLLNIFNAGITRAIESGIPIGQEYYEDIYSIKKNLYEELVRKEGVDYDFK